jgi:hypothetical protein
MVYVSGGQVIPDHPENRETQHYLSLVGISPCFPALTPVLVSMGSSLPLVNRSPRAACLGVAWGCAGGLRRLGRPYSSSSSTTGVMEATAATAAALTSR